ncbi:hypothetical protein FDP41_001894 [Naegleria fowleri]|uniref:Ribosomal RNA-processing protein 8 n=1 Tax=Naegleria fowleri TaxID=5763 RepID=A0A6A5BWY2_NAEFO|nr:uncharacterized protein FDP41_001894 [Naegleria fowleri]KAF0978824.1 hypothetical protein FDP41_001894 [Naegleria fowleri]CAG4715894.1 unnamed protein product [Naegleria fowleri]
MPSASFSSASIRKIHSLIENKKRKHNEEQITTQKNNEMVVDSDEEGEDTRRRMMMISSTTPQKSLEASTKKRKIQEPSPKKQQQNQPQKTNVDQSKPNNNNRKTSQFSAMSSSNHSTNSNHNNNTTNKQKKNDHGSALSSLQQEFQDKLKSSKFRFLNEKLYTTTGHQAKALFEKDPSLFTLYHEGYKQSMEKWPFQPVKNMIKFLNSKPISWVVADMGCGEAEIAKNAKQKTIHSFDLVATNDKVTACDMRKTPLSDETVDCVIFSLSLMGTNFFDYLREASRICKLGGCLRVAELESRFLGESNNASDSGKLNDSSVMADEDEESVTSAAKSPRKKVNPFAKFVSVVEHFGFKLDKQSQPNGYFVVFEFNKVKLWSEISKIKDPAVKNVEVLKPCLYKKR